jgi:predicted small metal-binding protein
MIKMETKTFSCPKCAFEVKAGMKEEVLEHAKMHVEKRHPEESMTEEEYKKMIK